MTNLHKQITAVSIYLLVVLSLTLYGSGGGSCSGEGDPDILNPPSKFWISSLSATSLKLGWYEEGGLAAEAFKIERSVQGVSFSEIGLVKDTARSFIDAPLDSTKTYSYRIRAINGNQKSGYSKTISAVYSLSIQVLRTVQLQTTGTILDLSLSPDGRFLATRTGDQFYIWNTSDWSNVTPIGENISPTSMAITHDSHFIVTAEKAKINVRRFPDLTVVRTISIDSVYISQLAITPNGELVAAIDGNTRLRLWDLNTGNLLQLLDSIPDNWGNIAISPDGKTLVECSSFFFKVWDLNRRTILKKMYGNFSWGGAPTFSNNGTILSVNVTNLTIVATNYRTSDWTPLYWLNTYAYANAFSPGDSIQVIANGDGGQIRMFRVADGSIIRTISSEGKTVMFIAFLPDGKTFFTVSSDGEVKIRSTSVLVGQWSEM